MKRLTYFFVALISVFILSGCLREGGYSYDKSWVLENGELTRAHNYVFRIPSDAGSYDLEIVSRGIEKIRVTKESDGLPAKFTLPYPPSEEERYKEMEGEYYLQPIRIEADANGKFLKRKMKFRIFMPAGNGYVADIIIIQSGK